jgi:hypothetical protein
VSGKVPVWMACVLLAPLLLAANPGAAEEMPATPEKPAHALCWRGKPLAECRSFLITEMGLLAQLNETTSNQYGDGVSLSFELGWMKNVSPREAIGFSGYALASDVSRMGVRGRYRRWLSRRTAIDVSPGILLSGENSATNFKAPGFVLGTSANLGDLLALTLEAEWSQYRDYGDGLTTSYETGSDVTFRGGAKLGSALGVVGTAALFALFFYWASQGAFD